MPELLGRREISLPLAGVKTNESISKHVHRRGFVLVYILVLRNVSYKGQYNLWTANCGLRTGNKTQT